MDNENISSITQFIFLSHKPVKSDIIISPGTFRKEIVQKTLEIYNKKYCPLIITTGGVKNTEGITEAEHQKRYLISHGVKEERILTENESLNTKQNAMNTKKILNENNIKYKKILLVSKTHHARRIYMTFKRHFPKSQIKIIDVVDDRNITKDNWYKDKDKREVVIGEIEKIGKYFLQGDLSF